MFEELQLRVVFLVRVFAALISHCEHKPFSRSDIGGRRSLIGARLPYDAAGAVSRAVQLESISTASTTG